MHLKAVDIFGYKSFAQKTHLDLQQGINGIVGPNGCGKSNIMESIRWCLGESSWKSLRAEAMTDVIFAGTARKPALSFCEVNLTFDNSSQGLPIPFSEVTVTRRLFRSGESLYFLNKSQCRLKDVRDLFLDTGLGSGGYAVIDQGRVETMISAKPDERRAFFEEAAGVAKYNARREEALKKLEHVEADMARVMDARALVDEQVKKLDSDAKKANLFQKYKEELSAAEASQILKEISRLEALLEEERSKRQPLEEAFGQKKVEIDVSGAEISALNLEEAQAQAQAMEAGKKSSEIKSQLARLEERIQSWDREAVSAAERVKSLQIEEVALKEKISSIDEYLDKARLDFERLEGELQNFRQEVEGEAERMDGLSSQVSQAQADWEEKGRKVLEASERLLMETRKVSEGESDLTRIEARIRSSLREYGKDMEVVASLAQALDAVRLELERCEQVLEESKAELTTTRQELENSRLKEKSLEQENLRLHSQIAEAQAQLKALEARGEEDSYWVGAQTVVRSGLPGILGTLQSLFDIEDSVRIQIQDILGEKLHSVVCEDSSSARNAIDFLKASGRGRCRFLVLSSIPSDSSERSYPEESMPLLSKIKFDSRYESLMRFLFAESYALGPLVFGDHWVCGGAVLSEQEGLSLADIERLRKNLEILKMALAETSAQKEAAAAAIVDWENKSSVAAQKMTESLGRREALAAQLSEKESVLAARQRNGLVVESEAIEGLREWSVAADKIKEMKESLKNFQAAEEKSRLSQEESFRVLSALKEKLVEEKARQGAAKARLEALEGQASQLKNSCERFEQEKESHLASIARAVELITSLSSKQEECALNIAQGRQELEVLYRDLASSESEAKAAMEKLQQLELDIHQKEESLKLIKSNADALQEELHKLDIETSASKSAQEGLKSRLWDQWQLTYDEAKSKYESQEEVNSERLEFLRKRINSLGNVNMAAPEEYQELTQKQSFLNSQIEDISKAREDLKRAIQTINDSTRENFRNTFNEIREHFKKLYGVLFEGGEADLVLSDPENILETGIEIMAQPPGKKLQSLSLLSGGEKALTAIALLFAFFMVRPSPFCMLDEADAALDDANVERFVGLLKEFEARTQFLIASHNKRTMEAASAIYGVTMEEFGISQLISVDFKTREAASQQASVHADTPSSSQAPVAA